MARTPTITGAIRGEDYDLVFIVRNDGAAVDMSAGTVTLRLDTGADTVVKTQADATMGADGQIVVPYTGAELDLRPGTYPFSIKAGVPALDLAQVPVFDGLFLIGAS